IPYKGYTITLNSERQPDGRWLPVAELEVSHRGVVTTQPSLRGTSREIRANRADADSVAVRMAKAWIDANERESATTGTSPPVVSDRDRPTPVAPRPEVPIARAAPAPPTRQEARAQDRRADTAARPKAAGDKRRPAPSDTLDWTRLCQAVGLDSDEEVDRLTRVLVVHSLLDRFVTLALATKLASSRESREAPGREGALGDIARLPIPARIDLVSVLGVIAPEVAESILEVDRARNDLVRCAPAPGKPAWDVSDAEEIASQDACDQFVRRGIDAVQALMSAMRARTKET
ncbi:MAG: hypothetical protein ACRELW_00905, partial [Candidatus Rokuibacteriota bacterium]